MSVVLVGDGGPVIALARPDLLQLPSLYFDSVLIASSVWPEVMRRLREGKASRLSGATDANAR